MRTLKAAKILNAFQPGRHTLRTLFIILFIATFFTIQAAPPGDNNGDRLCYCSINTWHDRAGSHVSADFIEFIGASEFTEAIEEKMRVKMQEVFENHFQFYDSYSDQSANKYPGSCSDMRSVMADQGIRYETYNTWQVW